MRNRFLVAAAAAVASALAGAAVAAEADVDPIGASVPFVRPFRDADGLPQNTVHSLAVDAEGFLWAGTPDGAARYDGRQWEPVELPVADGTVYVRALLSAADGALWIGTQESGLLRRGPAGWQRFTPSPETFPTPRVNALAESRDGGRTTLWLGLHDGGVAAFDGTRWRRWTTADGLPSNRTWDLLAADDANGPAIWVATTAGIARIDRADGSIEEIPGTGEVSFSSLAFVRVAGRPLRLLAGSYGGGLFVREEGGEWRRLGLEDGLPSLFVTDLELDAEDEDLAWVATDGGGVARLRGDRLESVELGPLFESRAAYKLLETTARQGAPALWIGTRNHGLLRLSEGLWRGVHPFGEAASPASAILATRDSLGVPELWVGLDGRGLALWKSGRWRYFDAASGALGHDAVLALAETREPDGGRRIWVGTRNGGLSEWDERGWRRHDRVTGALPSDLVQTLAVASGERGDRLWVGTREGLAFRENGAWSRPPAGEGWPAGSILPILVDEPADAGETTLWIGTAEGLFRARGGRVRAFSAADGLPDVAISSLHLRRDASGGATLWVGTEGGGLALLDARAGAPEVRPPGSPGVPRLPNGVVHAIVEDRDRRLYVSTNRGVVRLTADAPGPPTLELFTTQHGLPLNQGMRGAGLVDERGRVWMGTVGGVAVLDPAAERIDRTPKRLHVTLRRSNATADLAPGAEIDSGGATLVFRYVLLSFVGEPLTRYRTQLVGREAEPTPWSAAPERELGELPPGEYVFRAWGRDGAGNVSAPVDVPFRIRPALWQRRTVQGALALLLVGVAAIGVRARLRRHERREHELEELVVARTRRLERANQLLAELSYVDALTAVPNRRRFDEFLVAEWKRAVRTRQPLAVALVDVDFFKAYNDAFGHQQGDDCLRQVAAALNDALPRSGDVLARYGGEEFAVVLPATDGQGALRVGEQLRASVAARRLPHGAPGAGAFVTVSCGVAAVVPELERAPEDLVAVADRALYAAKRGGKNRVAGGDVAPPGADSGG